MKFNNHGSHAKVGDLVRIKPGQEHRYQAWSKNRQLMLVARASAECIAFVEAPKHFRPKKYFEVVSESR